MGKLTRLELYNFKSYRAHHVLLFGDAHFTSIIGPNGSGKSNSMDAISFVLGIKSSHLRSTHLRDLIYRGRVLKTATVNADGSADGPPLHNGANGLHHENGAEEDVGTQSQRQDATSAWVMAVYEDDAGEEQHWKRTITSAGQSEYRINNRIVTAKEYNEVLEAENILIKARNFLVFQGDVEAVASQSPKDLTRLVEQISGSIEYKAEFERLQDEAEKANEDQQFKQTQRRGINAEIKAFGEQKKEADSYNKKQDERDDAIVTHVLWKLYHFQQVIEESSAEIQRHQDELKEHKRNIAKYEGKLDEVRKEQAKAHKDYGKSEKSISNTERKIDDKLHDLIPIDEKILVSNKNLEKYRKRIAEVSKERDSQKTNLDRLKKDLNTVVKAQNKWEEDFKKVAKSQGKQLSDADLQEYNRLRAEVNKRATNAQIQLEKLTRQRKTDEETVINLKATVDEDSRKVDAFSSEVDDIQGRRSDASNAVKDLTTQIAQKKNEINTISSERTKLSQKRTELDEKIQDVSRRLLEADDGRRQSRKEVKQKEVLSTLKRMFPGVKGRVPELCKPKQKKFQTAVSTALGRNFDTIVVDTEKTARDCIQYLKEQQLGRAEFIPLDTIQVTSINSNLKGMHDKMRLVIDAIDYDNAYERAMLSVCGNAMVCDDMKTAKYLCWEKRVDAKAVTLDGVVIHRAGTMTGGQGPNDRTARKWDDSEFDNLQKVKEGLLAQLENLPKDRSSQESIERLRGELSGLEQQMMYAREELKALELNEESKKKELKFVQGQLKEMKPRYDEKAGNLDTLKGNIEKAESEVAKVEDEIFSAFCKKHNFDNIRAYEAQQGSLQQEASDKKLEFTKQKSKLEQQVSFEETRVKETQNRINSLESQSQRDNDLIQSLQEEKEAMQAELEEIKTDLDQKKSSVTKLKSKYDEAVERVAQQRRGLQKRSKDIDFVAKEISKHETDMQRTSTQQFSLLRKCKIEGVNVPVTEGSATLENLAVDDLVQNKQPGSAPDAMDLDDDNNADPDASMLQPPQVQRHGIDIDFSSLDDDLKEDDSHAVEEDLQKKIASLQSELAQLNPNMRAIDRLNSAQDRLKTSDSAYRSAQRLAQDTAEAFDDVREKRADLFMKAFNHISDNIGPVYRLLTRSDQFPLGGSAFLDTMSADDSTPFLGGLKYHAMPPLKRFRDMDTLSGGEKTIAALALLFAIHSFAPSPFFVLDEVDAALDVANVAKVARYLREHARPGMQFVVISLKTGLFQESDALVGVHRDQSANSSRVVTLDLRKYRPN